MKVGVYNGAASVGDEVRKRRRDEEIEDKVNNNMKYILQVSSLHASRGMRKVSKSFIIWEI